MGVIRFNGISSADFGCTIERRPNHTRGSRRGELIEVPGRNGVAVLEDGSFTTYKQEYVMAFKEGDTMPPYKRAAQVAEWLLGSRGFCRLEDDFEPNVYRMARYAGALNIEQVADKYGQVVLEFECQPQRFLKSGESSLISERVYPYDNLDIFEQTLTIHPIPANTKKVTLIVKQDAEEENCDGSLRIAGSSGSGRSATMVEIPGEGDMDYTNVMDSSSSRYIAGSRYSMNSHAFVDSENPECDCVVVSVPQNNETTRIRIKNATFSNWNTVYGGTTNNAFNKDYGRNPVNPSAPQDEYGDWYFDFQNDGSSFIVFNINPMSTPSSLIVTVNEPIVKTNADGISEYSGTLYVGESEINSGKNIIVKQIGSDSQNTFFDFIGNVLLYDADNKVIEQYITSGRKLNVFNKTEHESRPLIKVTGTKKNQAAPVSQSLTMSRYYWIGSGGEIVQVASGSFYVSLTVSVTGYAYAYIKGVGYVFTDINGKTRKGGFEPTGKEINKKVIIPSWATGVRVSQILDADPNYSVPASLSLQEAAPNPTTAVATINSTTINLNFSTYSTIYLDCDLHDAYYEDGSSANSAVSFSSTVTDYPTFPGLVPELNLINISSEDSITFEIVPRWWVL